MRAIILVGGYGTRLRPLTFSRPKPLVEFVNRPIVEHQIEALAAAGVTTIVLAVNYQPETMLSAIAHLESKYSIKIVCSVESEPLGTAGPIALAASHLRGRDDEPFFVLNSDVTCDYPMADMIRFHKAHGKEGTILVTRVSEPSKYGVVVHDASGKIQHFVEKPQTFVGNHINAGIYLLNQSVLGRIRPEPTSIEKDVFPKMAEDGELHAMVLQGYWMDIGQPMDFLAGMQLHMQWLERSNLIESSVVIHPTATVHPSAVLGPGVVVGPDVIVEEGARLLRSCVMEGSVIKAHAVVVDSIVGWRSTVGPWAHVESSVLGEDVAVAQLLCVNGAKILPHKSIAESIWQAGKIVM